MRKTTVPNTMGKIQPPWRESGKLTGHLPFDLLLGIFSEDMLLKMSERKSFLSFHCSAICRVKISKAKLKEQAERVLESTSFTSWGDLYLDLLWGAKETRQVPRKKQSEFCDHHSAVKEKVKADPERGVSGQLWQAEGWWLVLASGVRWGKVSGTPGLCPLGVSIISSNMILNTVCKSPQWGQFP